MWKAAFRGLFERKLRLALTVVSIMLGVAFVAGTYILTDSINRGFEEIFDKVTAGFDVIVRARSRVPGARRGPLPESVVEEVRRVKGVGTAEGAIDDTAQILDRDGKPIGGQGPPALAISYSRRGELEVLELTRGRLPRTSVEVAMDAFTASKHGFMVGERVKALVRGTAQEFRLTGTVRIQGLENLGGATMLVFDVKSAQQLFDKKDSFDSISVEGAKGVSQLQLRESIDAALPDTYEVAARDVLVDEAVRNIRRGISFLTNALLPFAFVGLFVGGFLIFNTFSIMFAQRVREFALLRAIGAKASQILRTVMAEAILIGAVASLAGVGLGVLLVGGLKAVLEAFGVELPSSGTPVVPRTVVVSLVLGVASTFVAALFPAMRARRVPPVEGLREGAVPPTRRQSRRRNIAGAILILVGPGLTAFSVFAGRNDIIVNPTRLFAITGAGALLLLLGVALLSPLLVRPLGRVIGWPVAGVLGVPGKVARGNVTRNPGRTAATAGALMIGVALVTFVAIFAASSKASVARRLGERLRADFVVSFAGSGTFLSREIAPQLEELPEVDQAAGVRLEGILLAKSLRGAVGVDRSRARLLPFIEMKQGRLEDLTDGVLVRERLANEQGWNLGSRIPAEFPRGEPTQLGVQGVFEGGPTFVQAGPEGAFGVDVFMDSARFDERFLPSSGDWTVYGSFATGVGADRGKAAVKRVLGAYPNARLFDQAGLRKRQEEQIDRVLALLNALLGLSLLIAVVGIVNTLALSVYERVREIGLLRAVGVTRRQIRSMVRWESVIVAVIGATLGIGVGILFFFLFIIESEGGRDLDIVLPVWRLLVYLAIAGVAGVVAAVFPARRAARLDVLRAIAYE